MIDFNLFSKMPTSFDIEDNTQFKDLDIEVNFRTNDFIQTIPEDSIDTIVDIYNKLVTPINTIVKSNDIADFASTMVDEFDEEKIVKLMRDIDNLDHEMYTYIINFIYNCAKAKADIATRNTFKRIELISNIDTQPAIYSNEIEGNHDIPLFDDSDEDLDSDDEEENVAAECVPENGDMTEEEYEAVRDKIENEGIAP